MKNSKLILAKGLLAALAALSCSAALAQVQSTNTVPGTYALPLSAANTNQPGFIWSVSKIASGEPNLLSFAVSQMAGAQGANLADPNASYFATGAATVPSDPTAPISFMIPGVIDFTVDSDHSRSEITAQFGPEQNMPGLPGVNSAGTDNIAAEALTYIALPSGPTLMGVRSDDGFRLLLGAANPADRYSTNAVNVAEFNGGRGAADNIIMVVVPKAGLYAARLLYENGGGNANVEWFSFPSSDIPLLTNTPSVLTNAVLINDLADGGIPAYAAVTTPAGSYVPSLSPTPGATGVSPVPVVTAQILNGVVPVTNITLSFNGTLVTPTITTSSNGALVSYLVPNFLPAGSVNNLSLNWVDHGTAQNISWSFTTAGYALISASQSVTPDTTKPGFLFNIFENSGDATSGDNDYFDNAELGLNGLLPFSNSYIVGSFTESLSDGGVLTEPGLPNNADVTATNIANAKAPALAAPAAPAKFQVAGPIGLTNGLPGLPGTDSGAGPSHSEVLTYVQLPAGLTSFTLNYNGYYRAFIGSWDYTKALQAGSANASQNGSVQFFVYATTSGYYPLRVTYLNRSGAPALSLYTTGAGGTNVLVGDTAHGGLAAYRALASAVGPYVRYTSPRNVPRQMAVPSPDVFIRLQDADTKVNDTSPVLKLDGNAVPVSTNRVGDVLELTYTPTTLQTPNEIHSALLTYKDAAGKAYTNQWSFMNLKAVWLPTNAVVTESFDLYTEGTLFTNTPAGTNWYVWNFDSPGDTNLSLTDPNGPYYANFVVVSLATFAQIESDSAYVAPWEMLNGQPITSLVTGNMLMAESDNRAGSFPGQIQLAISRSFNLSGVTNPVLAFASIYKQNQDSIGTVEYSVDGQKTWYPVIYYLDGGHFGSDPADLFVNFDGTVDAVGSLNTFHGDVPGWTDANGGFHNGVYGAVVNAPQTQALGPFFAPRVNDDKAEGKRLEVVRLPFAAKKSDVRLRLAQIGTCSWYYGVGNLAFYDIPLSGATVPTGIQPSSGLALTGITLSGNSVTVTWPGASNVQLQQSLNLTTSNWVNVPNTLGVGSYTTAVTTTNTYYRLIQH